MRNLLLGFLIGVLTATGAGVWAQSDSGTVFTYPGTGMSTFSNSDGTSGSIFTYPGTGMSSYQDSTGRSGTIFTYPGTGMSRKQEKVSGTISRQSNKETFKFVGQSPLE